MIYVGWAALYEGETDSHYFNALLPRVMTDLVLHGRGQDSVIPDSPAVRLARGTVTQVAEEACSARNAFHLIFIHADSGGRHLETQLISRGVAYCEAMQRRCDFQPVRCITVTPRHEMEAWMLADPSAVGESLGSRASADRLGLPADASQAERLIDPKSVLLNAIQIVTGRRRRRPNDLQFLYSSIAERQSLEILRRSSSFVAFESRLAAALVSIGCL